MILPHQEWWFFCSGPGDPDLDWLGWAYFLLTTPCVYQLATLVINDGFLLLYLYFAVAKLWSIYRKRRLSRSPAEQKHGANEAIVPFRKITSVGRLFKVTVALTGLGSLVFLVVLLCRFWVMYVTEWNFDSIVGFTCSAVQFASWFIFAAIVGHEKRFVAEKHPVSLRIWWAATFVLASWAFVSGVLTFVTGGSASLDEATGIVMFFISLFLLVVAIRGDTGLIVEGAVPQLKESLLNENPEELDH